MSKILESPEDPAVGTRRSSSSGFSRRFILATLLIALSLGAIALGFAPWLPILTMVVALLMGLGVGLTLSRESAAEGACFIESDKRFLSIQLLLCILLFTTIWIAAVERDTSELFVVTWSICVVICFVIAVNTRTMKRAAVLTAEILLVFTAFAIPSIQHYTTYHGAADLYFHLGIVNQIAHSAHVPTTNYASWPGWHLGVVSLSLVAGTAARISIFLFVGLAVLVAIPLAGSIARTLSRRHDLGVVSSVLLASNSVFLVWFGYLTPTSYSFGLFVIIMWAFSKRLGTARTAVIMIAGLALVFSHHLSTLITVVVLITGFLLMSGRKASGRVEGEMNWNFRIPVVIAVVMLTYWLFQNAPFFTDVVAQGAVGLSFRFIQSIPQTLAHEPFLNVIVRTFWNGSLAFLLVCFLMVVLLRRKPVLGIGSRTSIAFSLLAFLAFGSYISYLVPVKLLDFLLFFRWSLFGGLLSSIAAGSMLLIIWCWSHKSQAGTAAVLMFLLLATISSATLASPASVPFMKNHFGVSPRPYFLDSEEYTGVFVSDFFTGQLYSDQVFRYYFFMDIPQHNLNVNSSLNSLEKQDGAMLIRFAELEDRGLIFNREPGNNYIYVSYSEIKDSLTTDTANCVLDSGSTRIIVPWNATR